MSSVHISEFLSHPINEEKHDLIAHLLEVAKTSQNLFSNTNFKNPSWIYNAGLLHDIGKLNQIYQEIFLERDENKRDKIEEKLLKTYEKKHSAFSAWSVDKLLKNKGLDYDTIDKIMILVYGHHTKIKNPLGEVRQGDKFKKSHRSITEALPDFHSKVSEIEAFSKLDWKTCLRRFPHGIEFDVGLESNEFPDDYLEMSCAFSCLLQADRGSFSKWSIPNFDLTIDTKSDEKPGSQLSKLRTDFQELAIKSFDFKEPITIINAPTGIGKTKVFLDIVKKYSSDDNTKRVFYFSPLLALTDNFEDRIRKIIPEKEHKDVLIYNYLFSGSLNERSNKEDFRYSNKWIFENESFNKKFIIATTQRLLRTIYSNTHTDKLKMISFADSVLIIDEIQTIPKTILSNLKKIFEKMNQYMGTKFLLVSATIPHELADIKRIEPSKDDLKKYLAETKKQVSVVDKLDLTTIPTEKTLIMTNTRRKAVNLYSQINQTRSCDKTLYLSAGIKKKDRQEIMKKLSNKSDNILVSTQVVEAGVDISFSHVFREEAPLDNIIQVMGRLNREGENDNAHLTIYRTDGDPTPYSDLEFKITQEKIKNKNNSIEIYNILHEYYSEISAKNKRNIQETEELERHMKRLDFDEVWNFVKPKISEENNRDTVFIPKDEEWDDVRKELLEGLCSDKSEKIFKTFGNITASLPKSPYKIGLEFFDEELMDKNILLPKKEHLHYIYDKKTGLDKWLLDENINEK